MLIRTLSFLMLAFLCLQCKDEVDKLLTFTITDEVSFTVPASAPLGGLISIPTPDVTTNSSQEFSSNNTETALVKNIRLDQLMLTIEDPSGKNFNFLKDIQIRISSQGGGNEIVLAERMDVPMNVTSIELETTEQTLDMYVKSTGYKLETEARTRETLTTNIELKALIKYKVTATARR